MASNPAANRSALQTEYNSITDQALSRNWINVPYVKSNVTERKLFDFTVLSYNVLADNLLWTNFYLYKSCPPDALQWDYRRDKIIAELYQANADIVCLQEVHIQHYHGYIKPRMKIKGYIGAFEKRSSDRLDGCATFFKASKFKMTQRHRIDYRMDGISLMDRDNVGLILMLERQQSTAGHRRGRNTKATTPTLLPQSNPKICVANTHLLYNPKRGDIKLAQLSKLFAEIDQLTSAKCAASNITNQSACTKDDNHHRRHCPIILCGDFNSSPTSDVIQFVSEGLLRYFGLNRKVISGQREARARYSVPIVDGCILQRGTLPPWGLNVNNTCKYTHQIDPEIHQNYDTLFHNLNLTSIYRYQDDHVTTAEKAVDYIFYSSDRVYTYPDGDTANSGICSNMSYRIQPISYLNLYTKKQMNRMPCLPNFHLSSDHICLLSKLSYLASNTD